MDRHRIGIVIPALNEGTTIGPVVAAAAKYGKIIVVDDGSDDNTGEIATAFGAYVVRHEQNQGYDRALNSGFAYAASQSLEYTISLDADGQHDPEIILAFIGALNDGADVVLGKRNKLQRLGEHCFAVMTKILFGISDPLCGLKGYRMSVYNALGHFDSCGSIGTELALFAARNKYKIKQIPIIVSDREGASRFGRKLKANYLISRALIKSLFWAMRASKKVR